MVYVILTSANIATTAEPNLVENQKMKWCIIAMTRAGDVRLSLCMLQNGVCCNWAETLTMKTLSVAHGYI